MPEEDPNPAPIESKKIVEIPQNASVFQFKKKKFLIASVVVIVTFLSGQYVAYQVGFSTGKNSAGEAGVVKQKVATNSSETIINLKTGGLGDKLEVSSGVTIQLTDANIDQAYEQQKREQKTYYEKSASQSAYLNSDYFHQSNLILKISITNNNKTVISYNPASFRLKDSQDNQYVTSSSAGGGQISIFSLNPNETTKLTNSYLVPDKETRFKLIYENAVIQFSI